MLIWNTFNLECLIYENNVLIDIQSCSDSELIELSNAIIKTIFEEDSISSETISSESTSSKYTHSVIINLVSSKDDPLFIRKQKQINILKKNGESFLYERLRITPKNTLCHTWKHPVEVLLI